MPHVHPTKQLLADQRLWTVLIRVTVLIGTLLPLAPTSETRAVFAATPEYRIPCKVSQSGHWKVVRDSKGWTDQQLTDDININGRYGHGKDPQSGHTIIAVDFNSYTASIGARSYGVCEDRAILAARGGTVAFNGFDSTYGGGYTIMIDHNDGQFSYYNHMVGPGSVEPGQPVTEGTPIGTMGATGNTHGVHLHFDIRPNSSFGYWLSDWRFKNPFGAPPPDQSPHKVFVPLVIR